MVNLQGVKTVEREECKTVLENVCSVKFVTECGEKPSTNPIDSYGAPKAPLLRSNQQVADLGNTWTLDRWFSKETVGNRILGQVDSYGAPVAPPVQPELPEPICRKVRNSDLHQSVTNIFEY